MVGTFVSILRILVALGYDIALRKTRPKLGRKSLMKKVYFAALSD